MTGFNLAFSPSSVHWYVGFDALILFPGRQLFQGQ